MKNIATQNKVMATYRVHITQQFYRGPLTLLPLNATRTAFLEKEYKSLAAAKKMAKKLTRDHYEYESGVLVCSYIATVISSPPASGVIQGGA